jgi:hypothetical protein
MPIGVVIALLVVLAIIAALAFAVPRMGGRPRPRPRRRGPVRREHVPAADDHPTTRDERALIREGEAIREQVEARLARRQHRVRPVPIQPTPPVVGDELAEPAAYGTADPAAYPAVDGPANPAAYGARVRPRRRRLTARDELALQIERDRLDGYDPAYPGGPPQVDPELLPQTSSSDALERQLQEIAADSRTRPRPPAVVPPGVSRRRRRLGFARPHAAFEEEDDRLER